MSSLLQSFILILFSSSFCLAGDIDSEVIVFGVNPKLTGFLTLYSHGNGDFRIDQDSYKRHLKSYSSDNIRNFEVSNGLSVEKKRQKVRAEMKKALKRSGFKAGGLVELPLNSKDFAVYGGTDGTFSIPYVSSAQKDIHYSFEGKLKGGNIKSAKLVKSTNGKVVNTVNVKVWPNTGISNSPAFRIRMFYDKGSRKIIGLFQGSQAGQFFVTESL